MALQAHNLDSRTFEQLVKEARDRIPRYTPEWTNLNDSDPGMTLVKLQAWLTETLLYEVNRLPELNYTKFLQLLNVKPEPAKAATTELKFKLKKLDGSDDPLSFFIPKNAQVQADDPDLQTPVIFETDRTLRALNAMVSGIIASNSSGVSQKRKLVTNFNADDVETSVVHSFYPFGETPAEDSVCLVGILLRPNRKASEDYSQDVFPSGEMDLTVSAVEVFEKDENGEELTGPVGLQCLLPHELGDKKELLSWQVYVGSNHGSEFADNASNASGWSMLFPPNDESGTLSQNGHLQLTLPEDISQVSFYQLPRSFWLEMGLRKPPTTGAELLADIEESDDVGSDFNPESIKDIPWDEITPASLLPEIESNCDDLTALKASLASIVGDLDVTAISVQDWIDLDFGYIDPQVPEYAMAWIRVRLEDMTYEPKLLNGFFLNTVPATAAVTRIEENLGRSDGRPAQKFNLAKTPVYFSPLTSEPEIELDIIEAGESEQWTRVDDFYQTDSQSKVYQLDPETGEVSFGDGVYGRIPVAGATIQVRRYRQGGGDEANVGANTITKIKTSLTHVDSVTNPRAADGGSASESLENTKLRAPHDLKTRDRAVTAEDFAFLAKQTPGVPVHTAYALPRKGIDPTDQSIISVDGAVTVVILPANTQQDIIQPSEAQLEAVCQHLNSKRLITTELYVTGPSYTDVESLQAEIRVSQSSDITTVIEAIYSALLDYFHPLTGGDDGTGWPFGEDLFYGSVYQLIQSVEGVKRVFGLNISLEGILPETCADSLSVPDGHLIHLSKDVINLTVTYDNS